MGDSSHKLICVMRAAWVRSLALLGMTAWFVRWFLPKPALLQRLSLSQSVREHKIKSRSVGGKGW